MFTFRNIDGQPDPSPRPSRSETFGDLAEIKADIERLYFVIEALWRILKEKHGLDDLEIVRQITAIDIEDGKLDGRKAATPPKPCPKCGRVRAKQRTKCMYCGELITVDPFERQGCFEGPARLSAFRFASPNAFRIFDTKEQGNRMGAPLESRWDSDRGYPKGIVASPHFSHSGGKPRL